MIAVVSIKYFIELDKCLGDFHAEIEELEYRIIDKLGQDVMAHNVALQKPIKHVGQFDRCAKM